MKMKIAVVAWVMVFAMYGTGCGKKKLTDDQKATVASTLTSAGRTAQAVPTTGTSSSSVLAVTSRFHALSLLGGTYAAVTGPTGDSTTASMKTQLATAVSGGKCTVSNPGSSGSTISTSTASSFNVTVTVSGASCPISMNVGIKGSGDSNSAEVDATLQYSVNDDTYRKLNDIDSFDLSGAIKVKGSQSGDSVSINVSGSVGGKVHSQAKGDINFNLNASVDATVNTKDGTTSGGGSVSLDLDYPDFSAELKESYDGKTYTYEINGESVTADQFNAYFTNAGISSSSLPTSAVD